MKYSLLLALIVLGGCTEKVSYKPSSVTPAYPNTGMQSLVVADIKGKTLMKCEHISGDIASDCVLEGNLDETVSAMIAIINDKQSMITEQDQEIDFLMKELLTPRTYAVRPQPPFGRKL